MNEFEVVGHFMELSRKNVYAEDLAAGDSSYCYSSPICEEAGALEGFSGIHPFQPADSVQGAVELLFNLQPHAMRYVWNGRVYTSAVFC